MRDGDMPRFISSEHAASSSVNFHSTVFWTHSESEFLGLMKEYGFTDEWDLELLSAKYFRNLSTSDIAKELGYVSESTVQRRLREFRKELKKRGIGKRLK